MVSEVMIFGAEVLMIIILYQLNKFHVLNIIQNLLIGFFEHQIARAANFKSRFRMMTKLRPPLVVARKSGKEK